MTCKTARGFLGQHQIAVAETVNATTVRLGPVEALALLDGVRTLVAAKGKRVEVIDLTTDRPADDALLAKLIGPTGNLRAPTAKVGTTLVVGFNADAYRQVLGG